MLASLAMGRDKSQTSPSTEIDKTSLASLLLIDSAISYPVIPLSNSLTLLSGKVILIIGNYALKNRVQR
jgi:hypothetical protein